MILFKSMFKNHTNWFDNAYDPRKPELIIYPLSAIVWYAIFTFIFKLGANRLLHFRFKNNISLLNFYSLVNNPVL